MTRVERIYVHIGAVMRVERMRHGWTQENVAHRLGVTRTSVVNIEQGRHRVMLHDLPLIARTLGIATCRLFPRAWLR